MPRTIEGVTYESVGWDVREFQDTITAGPRGVPVHFKLSVSMAWETSVSKRQIFGTLTLQYLERQTGKVVLNIQLVGQFVADHLGHDALHGDMVGLPVGVWTAMAREVYDTARGLVLAKSKNLANAGIPTVPDEPFSLSFTRDEFGISHN